MDIRVDSIDDGVVIKLTGVLKKPDALKVADAIINAGKSRPARLALDCSELAAVAFDSVPFIVSALERARVSKKNVRALGCNNVVERTFRGADFERVGQLG